MHYVTLGAARPAAQTTAAGVTQSAFTAASDATSTAMCFLATLNDGKFNEHSAGRPGTTCDAWANQAREEVASIRLLWTTSAGLAAL